MLEVGILAYVTNEALHKMTLECLESYRGKCDRLILVENGGNYSYEGLADTYIKIKENAGYTRGVNTILRNASGEYIAAVNNDTKLLDGDLKDLCVPDAVTTPLLSGGGPSQLFGAFFVLPTSLLPRVGLLNENMRMCYSDTEFSERIRDLNIPLLQIESVHVYHATDVTYKDPDIRRQDAGYYATLHP